MKLSKKLLSLALALVMVLSLAVPAMAAEGDLSGSIVILHSNDVHGAVEGYATMAALKEYYEGKGASVLLVDAGDYIQGTTYVSASQGATAIELMNLAGYDYAALGNHEFDYGYENLVEIMKSAKFKVLSANTLFDGKAAFGTHEIVELGGVKVGIFGMETPETATKTHPAKIKGVTFVGGADMYACAQAEVDALKAEGAKYIVCLGHLGVDDETATTANRSIDMLGTVTGIDVVIDGHSHSTIADIDEKIGSDVNKVGDTLVTSTGTKFANFGVVTIAADGAITTELVSAEEAAALVTAKADVAAKAAEIVADIEAKYGATFAKSEVLLNGDKAPGNRTEETNLGNLITDAMLWQATKDGGLEVDDAHVVALTNGGGIRAAIKAGDITMNDVNTVLPFGNTVAIVYVTGDVLLEALEASTYCTPEAVGGFPQVAGINFSINTAIPFDQGELYPGTTYYQPAAISRVTINSINGNAFDPTATYAVVTNDFCAAGGDTYYAFSVAPNVMDTGVPMDEALIAYINEVLGGVVPASKYAEPAGNIKTVNHPADLDLTKWWYDAAIYCLDNGILNGTDKGFDANAEITTATVYQTLYNMEKAKVEAEGAWYAPAMTWAAEMKIFNGDVNTFADGIINRQNTIEIMDSYCAMKGVTATLFQGNESGDMMLDKALTRAEWAQVLVNLTSADAPKAEEPKTEAPKAEEPKTEAPKAEEPKAEAPSAGAQVFDATTLKAKADKEDVVTGEVTGFFKTTGTVQKRLDNEGNVRSVEVGKALKGGIQFTLEAPATVKVEFSSTGGSNTSACGIVDADNNLVAEDAGLTHVTGANDGRTIFTYTNLAAGTYKVGSPADSANDRGARVYCIIVE